MTGEDREDGVLTRRRGSAGRPACTLCTMTGGRDRDDGVLTRRRGSAGRPACVR